MRTTIRARTSASPMRTASTSNASSAASSGCSTTAATPRSSSARSTGATPTRATSSRSASSSTARPCVASGAARRTGPPWTRSSTGSSARRSSTRSGRATGPHRRWTGSTPRRRRRAGQPSVEPDEPGLGARCGQGQALRDRADVRGGCGGADGGARARLLHLRERRERAAGRPLPAARRPVRTHRAGHRGRVHDAAAVAPQRRSTDDRAGRARDASGAGWPTAVPVPMDHSPARISTGRSASRRGGSRAPPRDGHVDTKS